MADLEQWVNLPIKADLVEDEITVVERLGPKIHFECEFENAKMANFKYRCTSVGSSAHYTKKEKKRNARFRFVEKIAKPNQSAAKVKLAIDYSLPAEGGIKYKIEAKYKKTVVESSKMIRSWRRLYYQNIHMDGVSVADIGPTKGMYKKLFVVLQEKGGVAQIPFVKCIRSDPGSTAKADLIQEAKKGYAATKYEPNAFVIIWVNMISSPAEKSFPYKDSPKIPLGGNSIAYKLPKGNYLWWGMVPADDAVNSGKGIWLVQNKFKLKDDAGKEYNISDLDVTLDTTAPKKTSQGGHSGLKVALPPSLQGQPATRWVQVSTSLNVVKGFTAGYNDPMVNLITVAKNAWWKDKSDSDRLQTLNHELGHKIGMVPEGTGLAGDTLDKGPSLYGGSYRNKSADQKGHQGPHCAKGAKYVSVAPGKSEWRGTPQCVMFGSTGCLDPTTNTMASTPATFCGACEPSVKKLDLDGSGRPSLANSIRTK